MKSCMICFFIITFSPLGWAQAPPANPNQPGAQPNQQNAQANQPGNQTQAVTEEAPMDTQEEISVIQSHLRPFTYIPEELRDPFEPQNAGGPLTPGQVYGPFLEVQQHRLSDFTLKGLLWNSRDPVAVFRSPDGKDYRLTIKDYIGENFGYIAAIREKEVVVIQTIEEDNRRYSTTKVVFLEKNSTKK